jgi:uncharacterized protein GlcG (DUF336 family)
MPILRHIYAKRGPISRQSVHQWHFNIRGMQMNGRTRFMLTGAALFMPAAAILAAAAPLPGDRGRPMEGIMAVPGAPRPAGASPAGPPRESRPPVAAPSIKMALKAAQAIADACQQYPLGVAVTDAEGVAKLIYVPDRSEAWHGYSAVRKAYTAIVFRVNTSQLVKKAQEDADVAARVKADPNLQAFSGGVLVKVGDRIMGAIGVSGAEPGGHDEECALVGLEKIKHDLQ